MKKDEFLHKVTARYKYNPLWMNFLKLKGTNIKNKKWVFILGCYNSGTTLLDQILSQHPDISGLPDEGVMLTNQLVRPEDFGWRRMWSQCQNEMNNSPRNLKKNPDIIKRHWSNFYDLNKPFLLEKSISNVTRIEFLEKYFQPAYFIHIVRNGFAVSEGIHRKAIVMENNSSYKNKYPISLCAKQWVTSLEAVASVENDLTNFIEIKYEDLTENPEFTINSIMRFLEISEFETNYFDSTFAIHEKNSKIMNMNGNAISRLNSKELDEIEKNTANHLSKYNYNR